MGELYFFDDHPQRKMEKNTVPEKYIEGPPLERIGECTFSLKEFVTYVREGLGWESAWKGWWEKYKSRFRRYTGLFSGSQSPPEESI